MRATTVVNQPREIADVADVGAVHPQPRFLHGVVGLGQRPQHAVGDRPQMRTVLFERFAVHVAPPPVIFRSSAVRHLYDGWLPVGMTGRGMT